MRLVTSRTMVVLSFLSVMLSAGFSIGHSGEGGSPLVGDYVSQAPAASSISAFQDPRPDLAVNQTDLYILHNGNNVSSGVYGMSYEIHALSRNIGESVANNVYVMIGIRSSYHMFNYSFSDQGYSSLDCNATNNTVETVVNWTMNLTTSEGTYEVWVLLDRMNEVDESNETNNFVTMEFAVVPLETDIVIWTDKVEYEAGQLIIVTAIITYAGTTTCVPYVPVSFMLVDQSAVVVPYTKTQETSSASDGTIAITILIPLDLETGVYMIWAEVLDELQPSTTRVQISSYSPPSKLPIDMIVVAIAVGVAVAVALVLWQMRRTQDGQGPS